MSADAFLKQIARKRKPVTSFGGVVLEPGSDLNASTYFEKAMERLKEHKQPLQLDGAKFRYITAHGLYLVSADAERADFTGADLMYSDFTGANLTQARLMETNLMWSDFSGANLARARFVKANLGYAYLGDANLTKADLGDADVWRTNFTDAELKGADLRAANLERASYLGKAKIHHDTIVLPKDEKMLLEKLPPRFRVNPWAGKSGSK